MGKAAILGKEGKGMNPKFFLKTDLYFSKAFFGLVYILV